GMSVYPVWNSVFFFSSRRRHTRFSRDWSSDVCSSDLQSSFDFVDVNLPPYTVADGYSLLNASVTWDSVFGSNLSLMAFGSNLTDKEYVQAGTSSHSGFTGYTVVFPGAPRMYGFELSYRF